MILRCADRPYRAWTDESKETLRRSCQLSSQQRRGPTDCGYKLAERWGGHQGDTGGAYLDCAYDEIHSAEPGEVQGFLEGLEGRILGVLNGPIDDLPQPFALLRR